MAWIKGGVVLFLDAYDKEIRLGQVVARGCRRRVQIVERILTVMTLTVQVAVYAAVLPTLVAGEHATLTLTVLLAAPLVVLPQAVAGEYVFPPARSRVV